MKRWTRRDFLRHSAMAGLLAPVAAYWGDLGEAREMQDRKQLVTVFIPNGKVRQNPFIERQQGGDWSFARGFEPYNAFKSDAIALENYTFQGLVDRYYEGDHGGHICLAALMFSGEVAYARNGEGVGHKAPTIDQIVAWEWQRRGLIRDPLRRTLSIELHERRWRLDSIFAQTPPDYALGKSYGDERSGRAARYTSAPQQMVPVALHNKPREGFRQMFGDLSAVAGSTYDRLRARGASVLDLPARELRAIHDQLPQEGRHVLDQHLQGLRELERSLEADQLVLEPPSQPEDIDVETPANYERVWSQWAEVIDYALRLDRTRIVAIQLSGVAARFPGSPLNMTSDHHDYTHRGHEHAQVPKFMDWYAQRVAELLGRMRGDQLEGGDNLLRSAAVMVGCEFGHNHRGLEVPVTLFGQAGGRLRTGRAIDAGDGDDSKHIGTLLGVCQALDVPIDRLGNPDPDYQQGPWDALHG